MLAVIEKRFTIHPCLRLSFTPWQLSIVNVLLCMHFTAQQNRIPALLRQENTPDSQMRLLFTK